jgi:hypothetical protein
MSFFIKSNIKVDDSVASDFNDMVMMEMVEISCLWCFDQDNILYLDHSNYLDTNKGSISLIISCLDYLIKRFFEPRGVKLNGTIMAVGKDFSMVYVYNVRDNVIYLDTRTTHFLIEKYKEIIKEDTHNNIKDTQDFLKYNFELYHYASKRGCDLFDYFNIFV